MGRGRRMGQGAGGAGGPPPVPPPGPLRAGRGSRSPSKAPGGCCALTLAPMADGGAEPQGKDEHLGGEDPSSPQPPAPSPGHGRYGAGARPHASTGGAPVSPKQGGGCDPQGANGDPIPSWSPGPSCSLRTSQPGRDPGCAWMPRPAPATRGDQRAPGSLGVLGGAGARGQAG